MKDRQIAPFGDVHSIELAEGAFSPDGQWVAYRSRESEATPGEVFLQPFPATGTKYLVRNGSHVYWSPKGDELFVNAGAGTQRRDSGDDDATPRRLDRKGTFRAARGEKDPGRHDARSTRCPMANTSSAS